MPQARTGDNLSNAASQQRALMALGRTGDSLAMAPNFIGDTLPPKAKDGTHGASTVFILTAQHFLEQVRNRPVLGSAQGLLLSNQFFQIEHPQQAEVHPDFGR